jgi:hypothetical protein
LYYDPLKAKHNQGTDDGSQQNWLLERACRSESDQHSDAEQQPDFPLFRDGVNGCYSVLSSDDCLSGRSQFGSDAGQQSRRYLFAPRSLLREAAVALRRAKRNLKVFLEPETGDDEHRRSC